MPRFSPPSCKLSLTASHEERKEQGTYVRRRQTGGHRQRRWVAVKANAGACLGCGGSTAPWRHRGSGFSRCRRCGLAARDPMPSDDELATIYARHYADEKVRAAATRMASPDAALRNHVSYLETRFLSPNMKILDFGAGTGTTMNLLRNHGFDVDGVEFSEGARQAARTKYGLGLLSDLAELETATYDAILMIEVIEHLSDPSRILRRLNKTLKAGGLIYISTPNLNGLVSRLYKTRWREARKPFHVLLFEFLSLETMLVDCGYSDVRHLRFSPMTSDSRLKSLVHRLLQLALLYGGLRVVAYRAA